jgi:hypothetical protein
VHVDEHYFVSSTVAMVRAGDFNHREYRYPGLFFYLLAVPLSFLGPRMGGPEGFLVGRAFVGAFGVLNVALLYLVGEELVGVLGGFAAASLLAVLPLDIITSHQVRPEIPLTTAAILTIGALRRVGTRLSGDVLSGLAIGFGTAIKYSAPFLVPSYLLTRLLAPGRKVRGAVVALGLVGAVPVLCTPYALFHPHLYSAGPRNLVDSYYTGTAGFLYGLRYYLKDAYGTLGLAATLLCLAGIAHSLARAPRAWGPILVHPVVVLLVMSTTVIFFPRQILQAMPLLCLMCGITLQAISGRSRVAAGALLATALLAPLWASRAYIAALKRPSSEDLALDWVEAHLPPGAHVLETRPEAAEGEKPGAAIGIDPRKYRLLHYFAPAGPDRKQDLALLAPRMDLVIAGVEGGGSWGSDLEVAYRAPDDLALLRPIHPIECAPIDLGRADITASENSEAARRLASGVGIWSTRGPIRGGEWIEIALPKASPIGRVEVFLGNEPWKRPPKLAIAAGPSPGEEVDVRAVPDLPGLRDLLGLGHPESEGFVIAPAPVLSLRITQTAEGDLPWAVSGIRLEACREAGTRPAP